MARWADGQMIYPVHLMVRWLGGLLEGWFCDQLVKRLAAGKGWPDS